MKKIITILFFCFFFTGMGFGQSEKTKSNYLVLYSGKIITTKTLKYKSPYFYSDSGKIDEDEVSYYMNKSGRFQNQKLKSKDKKTSFVKIDTEKKSNIMRPELDGYTMDSITKINKIDSIENSNVSDSKSNDNTYLVLYSGKEIKCSFITYRKPYFSSSSGIFYEDSVKFYQNSEGSFANAKHLAKPTYKSSFLKAEKEGEINLYGITITVTNNGKYEKNNRYGNYTKKPDQSFTKEYLWYNKGTDSLKSADYKNLMYDLADNPKSIKLLKQARNIRITKVGLYGLCLAVSLVGIVHLTDNNMQNDDAPSIGIPVAVILYYVISRNNLMQKKIKKAIDVYNSEN